MKVIKDYLKLTGMSQADLARKAKIAPTAFNNLIQGRRRAGMRTLLRLNEATGISIENLVRGME